MGTAPTWALECAQSDCTFRPDLSQKMEVVKEHYETEHPEMSDDIQLNLVILCPTDGDSLIFLDEYGRRNGQVEGKYSCATCLQTYTLDKNPLEQ